jgi:hypothetical protein
VSAGTSDFWADFWKGTIIDGAPLVMTTGKLVCSDPILDPFTEPLTVRVRPGKYPVFFSMTHDGLARVLIQIREDTPCRWERADPPSLTVDSATGCLMDAKVARFLRRKADEDKYEKYIRRFQDAMEETNGQWGSYCFDQITGSNIILFNTLGGDGTFPCYFGYNEKGSVASFLVEMTQDLDGEQQPSE